jgi:hypothetical protein
MEGLGDIVVGAGVETLHFVTPPVARGEDEDGHGAAGATPGFQHRNAVHFRQTDIEDDGVVGLALTEIVALLAVESAVDDISGIGQRGCQLPIEIGVVLDDKKTQIELRSVVAGERAFHGIYGDPSHFAIARKDCQHVDEPLVVMAQPRPHHGTLHAPPRRVHGGRKPNELATFGLGAAFFLVEAGVLGLGANRMGVTMHRARGVGAGGMGRVLGADLDADKDERKKSSKGNSLRGNHPRRSKRRAVNPA